jgi:hypothetical protein
MTGEMDFCGVLISPLLADGLLALLVFSALRGVLARTFLHRIAWHPPLADLAVLAITFGLVAHFVPEWIP